MKPDEANKRLEQAIHALGEHFGSVVILASLPAENDGRLTQMARRGCGDWFAQQGMLQEELHRTRNVDLSYEIALRAQEAKRREEGKE